MTKVVASASISWSIIHAARCARWMVGNVGRANADKYDLVHNSSNSTTTSITNFDDYALRLPTYNRRSSGGEAKRGGLLDEEGALSGCRQGSVPAFRSGEVNGSSRKGEFFAPEAATALTRGKSMPALGLLRTATDGEPMWRFVNRTESNRMSRQKSVC